MNRNVLLMPHLLSVFAERFPAGRWSFLGPGSEKKWYHRQGGEWDRIAELMMIRLRESGHSVFRITSPLSRGTLKSKGGGKLSFRFCVDGDAIEPFLLIRSVSTEQSQMFVMKTVLNQERTKNPIDKAI